MLINVRMFHKKAETHNKLLRFAKEKMIRVGLNINTTKLNRSYMSQIRRKHGYSGWSTKGKNDSSF